ncbi:hypothetical protein [Pseudomonas vanderleydeniana]|uniref:O-antigen ligase domain-containing protein n=1 Tax=Pseudomonas vanderleydeniana TaxID=2745495 RepID=A0A9E6PGJ5_9PSED|nr:hypothetical protein [Pseudomonas vanderleydeniana]QXI26269.1 hypothetical protein HU752_020200 [Pseudomonas vanderleydeniana]
MLIILWMHLGDLVSAWLYGDGAWPGVGVLRYLRDGLVVVLAGCCLLSTRLPSRLLLPLVAYCAVALCYLLANRANMSTSILVGSYGTLMIPVLFFLLGFYCVRQPEQLRGCVSLLVLLGIASTLFGIWEQQNTTFWTETIGYPRYMRDIKGMALGANWETGLPWNFYGGVDLERRAAGLLAAPLAQGMFLAVVAVAAIAWSQRRTGYFSLLLSCLLFVGVWMSGTRGAMLAGSLALIGYLASGSSLFRYRAIRWLIAAIVCCAIAMVSYSVVQMSINFLDGSTIGHWKALQKNLLDLPNVLLLGAGIGAQGAQTAQQQQTLIGGGEGAIFSIAFQLGLPAALLFLWFYLNISLALWNRYRQQAEPILLAMFWLTLGLATTLISSEHLLTVSGTGAFWLLCGATLRSTSPTRYHTEPIIDEQHSESSPH